MDDLFGTKPKESTAAPDSFEFKLNDKYLNMSQQSAKVDDDFNFGGYTPSALASTSSQPRANGMKRNVSFTDDLFENNNLFGESSSSTVRPKTTSSIGNAKQEEPLNLMRTMPNPITKSTDDWLNNSGGNEAIKANSTRKSSEFSLDDLLRPRDTNRGGNASLTGSKAANSGSDLDWLGLKDSSKDSIEVAKQNLLADKPPLYAGASSKPTSGQNQQQTGAKDSMNSSFADSIENLENRPSGNNNNEMLKRDNEFNLGITSHNEGEDGWLNNLISNKKVVKKVFFFK